MLSRKGDYDNDYGHWGTDDNRVPVASTYRVAWRTMAATTGYRTLYPAIIPASSFHIFTLTAAGPIDNTPTVFAGAAASSILLDFFFRSTGKAHILSSTFEFLPLGSENRLWSTAARLYLRLNCLTAAYAPLWEEITGEEWTVDTPLRTARERRQAQNDLDAIVALSLGVSADELCMIYRTQFPVMRKYDQQDLFDANGRKVPKEILAHAGKLGSADELSLAARTWVHPQSSMSYCFELPFESLDREADLRRAFAKFDHGETILE